MVRRKREWNEPSRTDHYLMKLINTVTGIFGESESDFEKLKIKFGLNNDPVQDPTLKSPEYIEMRKQEAMARAASPGRPGKRPPGVN